MMDNGVNLILSDGVRRIGDDQVLNCHRKKDQVQGVIMCIGVRPETTLAREAGLEIGETGGILVDHNIGPAIQIFMPLEMPLGL